MKTVLIACRTLSEEIEFILKNHEHKIDEVHWIESGLHTVTETLKIKLQEELDGLNGADRVILAFGFCGNAIAGLKIGDHELIFPRVDDCIALLLGSYERKREIQRRAGTYFLTKGWLCGEHSIYREYLHTEGKYGAETASLVFGEMLKGYKELGIIDNQICNFQELLEETRCIAETLKLRQRPITGTLHYLKELLTGPWDSDMFVILPARSEIAPEVLRPA